MESSNLLAGHTETIASFAIGISFGILVVGVLYTSTDISRIRAFKMKLLTRDS